MKQPQQLKLILSIILPKGFNNNFFSVRSVFKKNKIEFFEVENQINTNYYVDKISSLNIDLIVSSNSLYFGKKILYMEKPELLSKSEYNLIHKDFAKKLLSTNNEKWNTIPRTYSEIDTLRAKFEKESQPDKLEILNEINAYVEELEKKYSSA